MKVRIDKQHWVHVGDGNKVLATNKVCPVDVEIPFPEEHETVEQYIAKLKEKYPWLETAGDVSTDREKEKDILVRIPGYKGMLYRGVALTMRSIFKKKYLSGSIDNTKAIEEKTKEKNALLDKVIEGEITKEEYYKQVKPIEEELLAMSKSDKVDTSQWRQCDKDGNILRKEK